MKQNCSGQNQGFLLSARGWLCAATLFGLLLSSSGCALQPPFRQPELVGPQSWSRSLPSPPESRQVSDGDWWKALDDPLVDDLVQSALQNSPDIAQALARADEAAANLGVSRAARDPMLTAKAAVTRGQEENTTYATSKPTELYTAVGAGPSLSWEVDLFGRVRENIAAARSRLDARTTDAQAARLTLAANVVDTVIALRACQGMARLDQSEQDSRARTLQLTALRERAGFSTGTELARLQTALASSGTTLAAQQQTCTQYLNALVALTGRDATALRQLFGLTYVPEVDGNVIPDVWLPTPPAADLRLPARVLADHPATQAAMQDLQAAWADIGVARAERYPRLDLAAALTDQWISIGGTSLRYLTWSIGPSLGVTVFDGGAGSAKVRAAQARYEQALATLQGKLRNTVQEVENALAAQLAAQTARQAADDAAGAAQHQLQAASAQLHAGTISQIDFEDTRRQTLGARQMAINARRDQARAWVALMKASGASGVGGAEDSHE